MTRVAAAIAKPARIVVFANHVDAANTETAGQGLHVPIGQKAASGAAARLSMCLMTTELYGCWTRAGLK